MISSEREETCALRSSLHPERRLTGAAEWPVGQASTLATLTTIHPAVTAAIHTHTAAYLGEGEGEGEGEDEGEGKGEGKGGGGPPHGATAAYTRVRRRLCGRASWSGSGLARRRNSTTDGKTKTSGARPKAPAV